MDGNQKLWAVFWASTAAVLVSLIGSLTACSINRLQHEHRMASQGYVRVATTLPGTSHIVRVWKKESIGHEMD